MERAFITGHGLIDLLEQLDSEYSILAPEERDGALHTAPYAPDGSDDGDVCLGDIRSCEPLKAFYFTARKTVAVDFGVTKAPESARALCLVGVKACDLKSLELLDSVFMDAAFTDPFYAAAREENLIISSDCTGAAETCFCVALGGEPFPSGSFDLNLSEVGNGYVVEAGSEKGTAILTRHSSLFAPAGQDQVDERDRRRREVTELVRSHAREHGVPDADRLPGIVARNYESALWREEAETCVECGACNSVCPTCHCFLIYDQQHEGNLKRYRLWDSCLIKDFAAVAGGANPRPYLWMRLRNRFEKKFDFFPSVKNIVACTGCGRCIQACPGKIDIRRILKRNVESVPI